MIEDDVDPLAVAVELSKVGRAVREFWLSEVGREIQRRIEQAERHWLDASADFYTDDAALKLRRIEYITAKRVATWLGEAVAGGMEAEQLLEMELEADIDTEDLIEAGRMYE